MTLNKAKKDAILMRREQVARLRLRGLSQREIAVSLSELVPPINVSYVTVKNDIDALKLEWQARAAESIDKLKAEQLAELREVKRRAWADNDLANLLRAIKQEAEIIGTPAAQKIEVKDWRDAAKQAGVDPAEVERAVGGLFDKVPVPVAETNDE